MEVPSEAAILCSVSASRNHEAELLSRIREGDRSAAAELLSRHQDAVYRFGRMMCGNHDDAEDVAQDTLMTALEKADGFRGEASFLTWLYAIARSQCSRKRRRGSREIMAEGQEGKPPELLDPAPLAVDALASNSERKAVQRAVEALRPIYREVVVLRDIEGLTAPEVAETLGLSVEAVKSRLHRGRAELRIALLRLHQVDAIPEPPAPGESVPLPSADAERKPCPDVAEMLSRHLEDELTGEDCAAMQKHIDSCEPCRVVCDELRHALAVCRQSGQEPAPPEVRRRLEATVKKALSSA
jgi:RNA polymerase sigma-70 factor (ECF subfamily)